MKQVYTLACAGDTWEGIYNVKSDAIFAKYYNSSTFYVLRFAAGDNVHFFRVVGAVYIFCHSDEQLQRLS